MILSSLATFGRPYGEVGNRTLIFDNMSSSNRWTTEVVNRTLSQLLRVVIQKNLKSWEECFPFVEFAYNRILHSTTGFYPFEILYYFNPLTPMDLVPLSFVEKISLDGEKKAKIVRQLHEGVRL